MCIRDSLRDEGLPRGPVHGGARAGEEGQHVDMHERDRVREHQGRERPLRHPHPQLGEDEHLSLIHI